MNIAQEQFPSMHSNNVSFDLQNAFGLTPEQLEGASIFMSMMADRSRRLSTPHIQQDACYNSESIPESPSAPSNIASIPSPHKPSKVFEPRLQHSATNNQFSNYNAIPQPQYSHSVSPERSYEKRSSDDEYYNNSRKNSPRNEYSLTERDVDRMIQSALRNIKTQSQPVRLMRTNHGTTLLVENDTTSISFRDNNKNIVTVKASYEDGLNIGNKYKLHNNSGILCQLITPPVQNPTDNISYIGRFVEVTGKALKLGELIVPEVQLSTNLNPKVYGVIRDIPKNEFVKGNKVHDLNDNYSFVTVSYKGLMETNLFIESDGPTTNFIPIGTIFVADADGKPKMVRIDGPDDYESYKSNTDSSSSDSSVIEGVEHIESENTNRRNSDSSTQHIKESPSKAFHPMLNSTLSYCQSFAIPFMKVISHVGTSSFVVSIC